MINHIDFPVEGEDAYINGIPSEKWYIDNCGILADIGEDDYAIYLDGIAYIKEGYSVKDVVLNILNDNKREESSRFSGRIYDEPIVKYVIDCRAFDAIEDLEFKHIRDIPESYNIEKLWEITRDFDEYYDNL